MNIFVLHTDPIQAARWLCDRHVCKMQIEAAQILCTAHPASQAPYKRTHYNHPCAVWVRESIEHYNWTLDHALAICKEYTRRYGKAHKTQAVLYWLADNLPSLPDVPLTEFVQAMPEHRQQLPATPSNTVAAYREYYLTEKSHLLKWSAPAKEPPWVTVAQVE